MGLVALKDVGNVMSKVRGFTLIELLVTIAVAIILATIAVPGFQRMMAVNRVAADYNEVLSGLNYARSEAVKRRSPVEFVASTDGSWKYVVAVVGGDDLRARSGRDGRTTLTAGTVTFNALGRRGNCNVADCTFTMTSTFSGISNKNVEVSLMGRVGKPAESSGEEAEGS